LVTIVFDGDIAWPPTRTVPCDMDWAKTGVEVASRMLAKRATRFIGVFFLAWV
jgi:hypothetical protein